MAVRTWVTRRTKAQTFDFYEGLVGSVHIVHSASINNATRAVASRVIKYQGSDGLLHDKPAPDLGRVAEFRDAVLRTTASAPSTSPLTAEEFISRTKGARKRQRMSEAGRLLGLRPLQKSKSHVKGFVKREAVPRGKPCRLIQARDDEYLFESARYLKPMEHHIYRAIDRCARYCCVMKGLNGVERAAAIRLHWETFSDPVAISLDFAKFDQHVHRSILECEHAVYRARNGSAYLARLLNWQLLNRGRVVCDDGVVKYQVEGCRMSGDPNTSLGNIIICATGHLEYARTRGIRCRVANDGDDSVIIVERADLARYIEGLDDYWLQLGFRLTVDNVTDSFSQIDFCQCRPVRVDGVWAFVRSPRKAVPKDLTCTQHLQTQRERAAWLWSVGMGGLSDYAAVPIMGQLYRAMVESGERPVSNYQWLDNLKKVQHYRGTGLVKSDAVSGDTRYFYWRAFGILPDTQVALEKEFAQQKVETASCQNGLPRSFELLDILLRNNT